jgi:hypothetical protein
MVGGIAISTEPIQIMAPIFNLLLYEQPATVVLTCDENKINLC